MLNSICITEVHCSIVEKEQRYVGNKAKGRISKRVFQENKARRIFRKTNISYIRFEHFFLPPDTYVCVSEGNKCSFFEKFAVLCFLEVPALRFALLLYYRRDYLRSQPSNSPVDCTQKVLERIES